MHVFWTNHRAKLCKILIWIPFDTQLEIVPLVYFKLSKDKSIYMPPYSFIFNCYSYFFSNDLFHLGIGPLYIKALALRGTLYTLISKVDEAIHDLSQVINADDKTISTKVDFQP